MHFISSFRQAHIEAGAVELNFLHLLRIHKHAHALLSICSCRSILALLSRHQFARTLVQLMTTRAANLSCAVKGAELSPAC